MKPEKVAIELNRRLVKSDRYDAMLNAGDEIEIVTFVGGRMNRSAFVGCGSPHHPSEESVW